MITGRPAEAFHSPGFQADLISYGMGERSIVEIADAWTAAWM